MDGTTETTTTGTTTTDSSAIAAAAPIERPTSAHDALTQAAAALETEASAQPDGATIPPAETTDPLGATPASTKAKEPPAEKWETILSNARVKASEDAIAKYREQHGWAEQVNRADYEEAARIGNLYRQDKGTFLTQLLTEAVADPTLAPMVRSHAARILGTRTTETEPDIPIMDDKGQVVAQLGDVVKKHASALIAEALGKDLAPIKADFESRQAKDKAAAETQALQTSTQNIYAEALDVLPHFKEHEAEISKVFAQMTGDDVAKDLRQAWKQVVGPKLEAKATAQVLDSFNKKRDAQTVDGSGKAASTPQRPRTQQELAAYMRSLG